MGGLLAALFSSILFWPPLLYSLLKFSACVDDGLSSCCCWADAERAETLLRLHECMLPAYEASGYLGKWFGVQNTASTSVMYHLQKVVEKHGRITVKSTRSISDLFGQDFTVSVSSGKALTGLDDDLYFLTSVIFNACINTFWVSLLA